jgi:hypothetical protein
VKEQKPVDDFFASKLAERIRTDNWRKQFTLIRSEVLEIAQQVSQQGSVDLKRETMELARAIGPDAWSPWTLTLRRAASSHGEFHSERKGSGRGRAGAIQITTRSGRPMVILVII